MNTPHIVIPGFCIVDAFDHGILVYRDEKCALILPPCRLMHSAKRLFEWLYGSPCRKRKRA